MSKARTVRAQRRLLVALLLGFVALTAAPKRAVAAPTSTNVGGLEFTYESAQGNTNTSISQVQSGVITITGSGDVAVSQAQSTQGSLTIGLKLGDGTTNYTGTLTLTNVNLVCGSQAEDGLTPAIEFANVAPTSTTTGSNACTVVLGEGATLTTPNSGAGEEGEEEDGESGIVELTSGTGDALVFQNGSSVTVNAQTENPIPAVAVSGTGNKSITFDGSPTIVGGTGASEPETANGTGALSVSGESGASLDIEVNAQTTISGFSGSGKNTPAPALTITAGSTKPAKVALESTAATEPVVTVSGGADLHLEGGAALYGSGGQAKTGACGLSIASGGSGGSGTAIEMILEGPGSVYALGGNGADSPSSGSDAETGAGDNAGGNGVSVDGGSGEAKAAVDATLTVNGGNLIATGGIGGSGVSTTGMDMVAVSEEPSGSNGAGGAGISLTGKAAAAAGMASVMSSTGGPGILNLFNGSVTAIGGASGSKVTGSKSTGEGGNGIIGNNTNKDGFINIENGSEGENSGPTLTVMGGEGIESVASAFATNGAADKSNTNAFTATNINVSGGTQGADSFYPYLVMGAAEGEPSAANQANLVAFNGMTTSFDSVVDDIVSSEVQWAQITPAPIEAVGTGVVNAGTSPANGASYVVAQTQETMSGRVPDASRTYYGTVTATFQNIENLDTSTFGSLVGLTNGKVALNITPNITSTQNSPEAGAFYVVPTGEGNLLTLEPATTLNLPQSFTKLYPELTTVGSSQIPVVYTVVVSATNAANGGAPLMANSSEGSTAATDTQGNIGASEGPVTYYTNPDGSGSLVWGTITDGEFSAAAGDGPAEPVAIKDLVICGGVGTPVAGSGPNFAPNGQNLFLGVFDEADGAATATQVPNDQVSGYSANEAYTAEFGAATLQSVEPSPASLMQGASVELTATYTIDPVNNQLGSYSLANAGINSGWQGIFVNTGTGSSEANGVSVEETGGTEAQGTQPFSVTSVATVSASATADPGTYRMAPSLGNGAASLWSGSQSPLAANPPAVKYANVNVTQSPEDEGVTVVRLYNPFSLEHLYTTDASEVSALEDIGWNNEGEAWVAPSQSDLPIYRLYNEYNGDHLYTTSQEEYDQLQADGWTGEGEKLWSAPNNAGVSVYRLFNPYMTENAGAFSHLWTGDFNEYTELGSLGWKQEGVAFWALSIPEPL